MSPLQIVLLCLLGLAVLCFAASYYAMCIACRRSFAWESTGFDGSRRKRFPSARLTDCFCMENCCAVKMRGAASFCFTAGEAPACWILAVD